MSSCSAGCAVVHRQRNAAQFQAWARGFAYENPGLAGLISVTDYVRCLDGSRGACTWQAANAAAAAASLGVGRLAITGARAGSAATHTARSSDDLLAQINALSRGKQSHVRTVSSTETLRGLFDNWTRGAQRMPARGSNVPEVYRLPDGTVIQWRLSSRSGGATIDITLPNGSVRKVHLP